MLRREGWRDNKKRVHRLYRLEGLQVRMRMRRKKRLGLHRGGAVTIRHFSDLLGVDHERVRLWTFARAAAEPRDWTDNPLTDLAAHSLDRDVTDLRVNPAHHLFFNPRHNVC